LNGRPVIRLSRLYKVAPLLAAKVIDFFLQSHLMKNFLLC